MCAVCKASKSWFPLQVSQARRVSKAHESMMSDEEKKKRRKKIRKELSQQESQGEVSYPTSKLTRQASAQSTSLTTTSKNSVRPSSGKAATTSPTKASSNSGEKSARCSHDLVWDYYIYSLVLLILLPLQFLLLPSPDPLIQALNHLETRAPSAVPFLAPLKDFPRTSSRKPSPTIAVPRSLADSTDVCGMGQFDSRFQFY